MQVWEEHELIHEGAEAVVHAGMWMGRPAIRKYRRPRAWRHPDLDSKLTQSRLSSEARLLLLLQRRGLPCPAVYDLDIENGVLVMGRIAGRSLVEILRDDCESIDADSVFEAVGAALRGLHRIRMSHGDTTTTNVILQPDNTPMLIDYGLGRLTFETEAFGLDLHVLHECLLASHPDVPQAMERVCAGYAGVDEQHGPPTPIDGGSLPGADEVLARFEQIKTRVRYHG